MPTYTLDLSIGAADLETIKTAGENIIVAKPVNSATGTPNVAWLSINPLEGNQITWTEDYAMFASTTSVSGGANIFQVSATSYPADDGMCYEFDANGAFGGSVMAPDPVTVGQYSSLNNYTADPAMTFGLTQSANTTSGIYTLSPLNAQSVPSNQQVIFTPFTIVWVWLEASLKSGVVLTEVVSQVAVVTFGGSVTSQTLDYSAAQGQFVPPAGASNVQLLDFRKYARNRRRKLR
jgi:hypothetical protein